MTREQAKELLLLVEGFANGKTVQWQATDGGWVDEDNPSFAGKLRYRLKPSPKRVPLGPDDVPPGSVIRDKSWTCSKWVAIIQCDELGVWWHCCDRARSESWASLVEGWEISRDNGKTWLPCWKESVE